MHKHHLKYALYLETNQMIGVDNVSNGLSCGCICPHCKEKLVAKNGGHKKEHHFAHYNGADCAGARMTALHKLTQQILARDKVIMLPDYQGEFYYKETKSISFEKIYTEKTYYIGDKQIRPDCVGIKYDDKNTPHELWIEILVTHRVNEEKQNYIRRSSTACIEIDMSDLLYTDYTEDSISYRLQDEKNNRIWVSCPKYDEINEYKRLRAEQEEAEQLRLEKEEKLRQDALRSQFQKETDLWCDSGKQELANTIINKIKADPYSEDIKIYDVLVPQNNFMKYIKQSPKNAAGLEVFYTLLKYYHHYVTVIYFPDIKRRLRSFQYNTNLLSKEEQIELEELITLRTIYFLESQRTKYQHADTNDLYKTLIKQYIKREDIRTEILMVSSVLYHHIVGADSQTFGELTREIIQHHSSLTKLYLAIIKSQDKYPNDYTLGEHNMLVELQQYVDNNEIIENKEVGQILKACYSFAFRLVPSGAEQTRNIGKLPNTNSKSTNDYLDEWKKLNEWYKES